mmetsp:Transcript_82026/g.171683  ORF Transcript_82026/g.171683 Transcript_82026/m.171683 type:complete len:211 (+) Transcript_82026:139-771(+)|eukprot:CAMPEP_0206488092 /NCGR_PEP_ID=MMETSP0324_2-20121206/42139_1 /ASSEMBLY_ACC=CAM_ASM_000836 /TAXON_ID=2866 /ORGANISM="Crypthecodinium cohnii, Strain Seligo" /LENGTH=210 /DNA_ID=CAMNT_0053966915 /DNA_START=59 /DNA_END=691 /DNA_ORIENTATION=-
MAQEEPHIYDYIPFYKLDEAYRECMRKEERAMASRKIDMTDADRAQATSKLVPALRPRPIFDATNPNAFPGSSWGSMKLSGLAGRPDLNGSSVVVVDRNPDATGRIKVRLTGSASSPTLTSSGSQAGGSTSRSAAGAAQTSRSSLEGSQLFRVKPDRVRPATGSFSASVRSDGFLPSPVTPELNILSIPPQRRSYNRKPNGGFYSTSLGL